MQCKICNFNRYIEKCHIIPKRLYGGDDENNIVYLCPNHHKLLDNGLLNLEELALLEKQIIIMLRKAYKRDSEKQYKYLLRLLKLKAKE